MTTQATRSRRRMQPIRILIADDHPLIIEGLTLALGKRGIEVVGHASAIADAVREYRQHKPDVVVMDVGFGQSSTGLDAAREILGIDPDARIVFYTQYDQDEIVREAYRLGGRGFVPKVQPTDLLADVIGQVQQGKIHFLPEIAERLALMGVRGGDDSPRAKLDARELDVFRRLAQGQTIEEIAGSLSLSRKTISLVVQAVKDKLGVQRSADITRLAIRHHIIET
ncbi:response regulator transcription factor [uncultured Methylibium sp.]|uniref:response regulator n=1 Tax=uncultured Methylibium sp. TaxID=381093 RepID=UPI0025D059F2|nr:response regulator transcription factor [uncultured Methylibium sp.]